MGGIFVLSVVVVVSDLWDDCLLENKYRNFWNQPIYYVKVYTADVDSPTANKYLTYQWVVNSLSM